MTVIKLDELTYPQVAALLRDGMTSLLWPVGTLEAHGRHAPVGTDNFCAENIAWQLGERLGWPVAPTLNYGITTGLIAYPGSIRIGKSLYADLIRTILENFFQMGFRRIVIANGHGGNTETIGNVIKDLILEDRGRRHMILVDWWRLTEEALKEVYDRPGGHAALDETACVIAYRPDLIDPSEVKPEYYNRLRPGIVAAPYSAALLTFEDGDATPDLNRDKASRFMDLVLDRIVQLLKQEIELFETSFGDMKGG